MQPLLTGALLFVGAGVANGQRGATVGTLRDSSGIRIYTYPTPETGRIGVTDRASLEIRDTAGCEFNHIAGLFSTQGGFVVANAGNHELCLFDAMGRLTRRVGRVGRGPGEFSELSALLPLRGDTFAVVDRSGMRTTVFRTDGSLVGTFPTQPPADSLQSGTVLSISLADASILLGFPQPQPTQLGLLYMQQHVYRFFRDARPSVFVGRFLIREHLIQPNPDAGPRGIGYYNRAFGRVLSAAPTSAGFVAGDGEDWSIREYDLTGRVIAIHRVQMPVRPITQGDIQGYTARMRSGSTERNRASVERIVSGMIYPRNMPAYREALTGTDGRIWLRSYADSLGGLPAWVVLNPQTRVSSLTVFPSNFLPREITNSRACGVGRDRDELEVIRCYPLVSR